MASVHCNSTFVEIYSGPVPKPAAEPVPAADTHDLGGEFDAPPASEKRIRGVGDESVNVGSDTPLPMPEMVGPRDQAATSSSELPTP
jgi:hypothetical protein